MSDLHEPGTPIPCEMAWLLGGSIVGEVTAPESEDIFQKSGNFNLKKTHIHTTVFDEVNAHQTEFFPLQEGN